MSDHKDLETPTVKHTAQALGNFRERMKRKLSTQIYGPLWRHQLPATGSLLSSQHNLWRSHPAFSAEIGALPPGAQLDALSRAPLLSPPAARWRRLRCCARWVARAGLWSRRSAPVRSLRAALLAAAQAATPRACGCPGTLSAAPAAWLRTPRTSTLLARPLLRRSPAAAQTVGPACLVAQACAQLRRQSAARSFYLSMSPRLHAPSAEHSFRARSRAPSKIVPFVLSRNEEKNPGKPLYQAQKAARGCRRMPESAPECRRAPLSAGASCAESSRLHLV